LYAVPKERAAASFTTFRDTLATFDFNSDEDDEDYVELADEDDKDHVEFASVCSETEEEDDQEEFVDTDEVKDNIIYSSKLWLI
jgi:hypothetical protein